MADLGMELVEAPVLKFLAASRGDVALISEEVTAVPPHGAGVLFMVVATDVHPTSEEAHFAGKATVLWRP